MSSVKKVIATLVCGLALAPATEALAQPQRVDPPARIEAGPTSAARVQLIQVVTVNSPRATVGIARLPGSPAENQFLVGEGATADDLARALFMFKSLRARTGDVLEQEIRGYIIPKNGPLVPTERELAEAQSFLDRLMRAEMREVSGHGRTRALEIAVAAFARGRQ